jgi:hypothetical protein
MGATFWMESVAGRTKKDAKVTGHYTLESRLLLEYAEAVADEGLEEPEGVAFDWIEADDYAPDDPIVPRSCFAPNDVIPGLLWLQDLAKDADDPAPRVWMEYGSGAFSPKAFREAISPDLTGLLKFCRAADARGEKLRCIWVL